MKSIKRMVKLIDDELAGAECYAEKMVESLSTDDRKSAEIYKGMANDEMRHAMTLHEKAVQMIDNLRTIYTAPQEMLDKWETSHNDYIKRTGYIKQMIDVYKD